MDNDDAAPGNTIFDKFSIEATWIMSQAIRSLGNDYSDDEPGNTIFTK